MGMGVWRGIMRGSGIGDLMFLGGVAVLVRFVELFVTGWFIGWCKECLVVM